MNNEVSGQTADRERQAMKRLGGSVILQVVKDVASAKLEIARDARQFMFSQLTNVRVVREHWLQTAGMPEDSFKPLAGVSPTAIKDCLDKKGRVALQTQEYHHEIHSSSRSSVAAADGTVDPQQPVLRP